MRKWFLFHVKSPFRSWDIYIFGYVEKCLNKKAKLNLKIYDTTGRTTIITLHILLNISRSEGNQKIKFGQLAEYNTIIIFLEKSYAKCGREVNPRPFYKIFFYKIEHIYGSAV